MIVKSAAQSGFDAELALMDLPEDVQERKVQPHVALYITFLNLFRYAQDSLNDLGKGHIDYYYEQVLGLRRRPESPDEVWLLLELAQEVSEHLLEQGTLLPAGKDKNGQPLLYETIENWVLRRAQVADLKNTYFDKGANRILANPDVKKAYANGLEKPNEKAACWRGMGDDPGLPDGEVGFAIASPQLILREGKRVVDVRISVEALNVPGLGLNAEYFQVLLSSPEKWIRLDPSTAITENSTPDLPKGAFNIFFKDKEILIRAVLERDDAAVDTFGPDMAVKAGFDTRWPMMKVVISPEWFGQGTAKSPVAVAVYEKLRPLKINEIKITVDVKGIKENLIIQSDQGVFDGTQKVFPFGPVPEEGNRFYIGSTEVFQKALTKLQVKFDWIAPPPKGFAAYYAEYQKVNFPTPNPKVRIEFVDRADDRKILISRVLRNGVLQQGARVKVKITDINFNPVENVSITSSPVGATLFSLGDGTYEIALPPGFDPFTANIALFFSKNLEEDYEPYSVLLREQTASGLNQPTAEFDIVLFPRQKKFSPYAGKIQGILKSVYGEDLTGASINNQSASFSSGRYELGLTAIPPSVEFSNNDYDTLTTSGDNFSIFDAFMYPIEKNPEVSGSFNDAVEGKIQSLQLSKQNLKGVVVVARNTSGILITTKTTGSGDYNLAGIQGATHLDFYFEGRTTPVRTAIPLSNSTINLQLPIPQVIFQRPSEKMTVNGFITGNIGDVTVKDNKNSLTTTVNNGFQLLSLDGDEVLTFSKPGYLDTVVKLERNTRITVTMIRSSAQFAVVGAASGDTVKINFPNISPTLLSDFDVQVGGASQTGQNINRTVLNEITLNGFSAKSNIRLTGSLYYEDINLGDVEPNIVIGISNLVPRILSVETGASGKITGRVISLNYQTVAQAFVEIQNQNHYFGVWSNADGTFEISVPPNVPSWQLKVSQGDTQTHAMQSISTGQRVGILIGHIQKPVSTAFSFKGTVSPSWDSAQNIQGVKVVSGNVSVLTNKDGAFDIKGSPSNAVTFSHPLYEDFTTEVQDNSELKIILLPKKSVFKVFEGNVSDIFGISIRDVDIITKVGADTFWLARSDKDGNYRVALPESVKEIEFVAPSAEFEPAGIDVVNLSTQMQSGGSKSLMAVRMYYGRATNAPLIDNDALEDAFEVKINALNLKRDIRTQHFEKYSPTLKRGFIRLTLAEGDFLHKEYSKVLLWYAINAGQEGQVAIPNSTGTVTVPPVPNEPYTPATNSISLDYTSEQLITHGDNIVGGDGSPIDQYFQLLSFNGHKGLDILTMQPEIALLYPYRPDDAVSLGDTYATGNLFIGLSELQPGGTLSLLVQVAGGTEVEPEMLPPDLVWSYLSFDNTWVRFNTGQILKDETNGLTRSGMIQLSIPTNATNVNTMLDPNYYWLRVAALENKGTGKSVRALPCITRISAQVVRARFKNESNELSHLGQPLPTGTISGLLESRTAVKGVEQPLPSFGGRLPESAGMEFYHRVSERLRHRHRAVAVWDYEHLLLEKFLELAAAKCIQHTRYKPAAQASQLAPGYVTVAVIPALSRREGPWPEPRFPKGDLDDMRAFLLKRTNLFVAFSQSDDVHFQVVNPLYEKVNVEVEVKFTSTDEAYYKTVLEEDIRNYLSPWLKDANRPPAFGRKLQRSRILEFIEQRMYVNYVGVERGDLKDTSVQYLGISITAVNVAGEVVTNADGTPVTLLIAEDICPSTARSILVAGDITIRTAVPANSILIDTDGTLKRNVAPAPPQAVASENAALAEKSEEKAPAEALKNQSSAAKPQKTGKKQPKPKIKN